ncbi:MAG: glycosyltransferase family 2 protein [Desulfobacterales bacterium]|nr:glycosyltransferase family 2 protein [Desulfobacterales bacterium]MCP4159815.1 glycosyltransferase family 2 protein [Deltaproteobacteria bacterium]
MKLSIVIPALNETCTINETIESIYSLDISHDIEIIVVDGNPDENTLHAITYDKVIKISSTPGRGIQMNKGAEIAKGEVILFLHSDTKLPSNAILLLMKTLENVNLSGGAFDLSIDSKGFLYRVIERVANIRSRITNVPFGDQGIFIRKDVFDNIGGYKEIPIMEDIDLARRLKKNNSSLKIIKANVLTSARRWKNEGVIYCTLRNWFILALFFLGVSPFIIKRLYK